MGKVLLRANELKSLRLQPARSMPLHSTELVIQVRGDGAAESEID
jgi:hypothetical protein